jgi:hypothetical protein
LQIAALLSKVRQEWYGSVESFQCINASLTKISPDVIAKMIDESYAIRGLSASHGLMDDDGDVLMRDAEESKHDTDPSVQAENRPSPSPTDLDVRGCCIVEKYTWLV